MNPLDSYLARVARELRVMPPARREDELRELRSHLEQSAEDFEAQGLSTTAAQRRATEVFGAPNALGSRLADAWEGTPFSWWRVGAICGGITLIWIISTLLVCLPMAISCFYPVSALFPEFFPITMAFYFSIPLLCGALFTHYLGHRGRLIGTVYFFLLFWVCDANLRFTTPSSPGQGSPPPFFTNFINSASNPLLTIALCCAGACLFYALDSRTRLRLAEISGSTFAPNPPSTRHGIRRIPLGLRTWLRGMSFCTLCAVLAFARISFVCHPSTPASALRYSLIVNQSQGFEAPQFFELRELSPTTPAQRTGHERRVRFQLQVRAKPYFVANQLAQLNHEAAVQARSKQGVDPRTTATIARVRANHATVKGIALMVQTSKGWKVDEKSFDRSQLWAWFYEH